MFSAAICETTHHGPEARAELGFEESLLFSGTFRAGASNSGAIPVQRAEFMSESPCVNEEGGTQMKEDVEDDPVSYLFYMFGTLVAIAMSVVVAALLLL